MIKAVRSDQKSFKQVVFEKGFNIILADRKEESSEKDSRNGAGKTTLIEIIDFCLGSYPDKGRILRAKELENWTFTIDLTLRGKDYSISRNTGKLSSIFVQGDFSDWPIAPIYEDLNDSYSINYKDLRSVLGYLMFGLPINLSHEKYTPTFRSLISYFIRNGLGAFQEPFKHHSQQSEWDIQVNNSYLLNLNWQYAQEAQILKDKKKILENLRMAANQGMLEGIVGTRGELEAEKIRIEQGLADLEQQLKDFKVHPLYYAFQKQANDLTKQMHELANINNINKKILDKYEDSLIEEEDKSADKVSEIYTQAGLIFSNNLKKKLGDVQDFHHRLIENRKEYLKTEIIRLGEEIGNQEAQIEMLSTQRAVIWNILKTHGALDEYTHLVEVYSIRKQKLIDVTNGISNLVKFDVGISELKIEKARLLQKLIMDFNERTPQREQSIKYFNNNCERLYSEPGTFSIETTENGYKFKVDIKRAKSEGVGRMKVFCYDLMLSQLWSQHVDMPGFCIHDSTIFDAVDERQVARAMELAAEEAENRGFQYICTLNSDKVPYNEFSNEFKKEFKDYIRIKFNDATEDGGLLGFRF
jgi:uncharacterized protein YydD (DUF2326 family)